MKPIVSFLALFLLATALIAAEPFTISGLAFKPPAAWTSKTPSSSMRAAELEIKASEDAKPLVAVFYYFGAGQGGSTEANIARWLGQFEGTPEQESKEHEFDGKTVKVLHAKGTYLESMGGPFAGPKTPRPDYALLGAIVPGNDANIFIKLTGPQEEVAAIREKFTALVTSPFAK